MKHLRLTLDENRVVNANDFINSNLHLLKLLDDLCEIPLNWEVADLQKSSARVDYAPFLEDAIDKVERNKKIVVGEKTFSLVTAGFRDIDLGLRPENWSPNVIESARHLINFVKPTQEHTRAVISEVKNGVESNLIYFTPHLIERISELKPKYREYYGSVRGRLVGFSVSRGNRATMKLQNGKIVQIRFNKEFQNQMKDALLKFVEIEGFLKKDEEDMPFWIHSEGVRIINEEPKLKWSDLFGIDPNFTGGLSSAEYIKAIRGEK